MPETVTGIDETLRRIRYEEWLPRAIEEEKRNEKARNVYAWMIVSFVIYFVLWWSVAIFLQIRFGIMISDFWMFVTGMPGCLLGALGILGVIMNQGNSVMELERFGDTYVPKNP